MDKMSAKFNQMMGKENHKTTKDVNIVEKQANQTFIKDNINYMKRNKDKTFLDLVMDDSGIIEEYTFELPYKH